MHNLSACYRLFLRILAFDSNLCALIGKNQHEAALRACDVVAVCPLTEQAFTSACKDAPVDLLSLDLHSSSRLPFPLRPPMVRSALDRGLFLELHYSPALRDPSCRRHFLSQALQVVRACRGRQRLVWSSGAREAMDMRAPYDAMNLGSVVGLSHAAVKQAMLDHPRLVLLHAHQRQRVYRSVIEEDPEGTLHVVGEEKTKKKRSHEQMLEQ